MKLKLALPLLKGVLMLSCFAVSVPSRADLESDLAAVAQESSDSSGAVSLDETIALYQARLIQFNKQMRRANDEQKRTLLSNHLHYVDQEIENQTGGGFKYQVISALAYPVKLAFQSGHFDSAFAQMNEIFEKVLTAYEVKK